ncbi:hypothetical protein Btru_057943 [Bulinus truncatus]|nr:hypothetical protein Btru_057943 [Bulinus truncatus]
MGASPSSQLDPRLKGLFQEVTPETDEYIHGLYRGKQLAEMYSRYRPGYPQEIFDQIISYHDELGANGRQLAVDVCCGSGQSAVPLVKLFDKVIGVDVSQDLLDHLPKDVPNLTYYMCPAEDMPMIDSGTVDLVTVGAGLHWLDIDRFFPEVKRILKPGGTFAAYTWLVDQIEHGELRRYLMEAAVIFKDYYTSKALIGFDKYQSVEFPFQDLRRFELQMKDEMTMEQWEGFIHTFHSTKLYYEAHPGTDIVGDIIKRPSDYKQGLNERGMKRTNKMLVPTAVPIIPKDDNPVSENQYVESLISSAP